MGVVVVVSWGVKPLAMGSPSAARVAPTTKECRQAICHYLGDVWSDPTRGG